MKRLNALLLIVGLTASSLSSSAQDLQFEKSLKWGYNNELNRFYKTESGNLLLSTYSRPSMFAADIAAVFMLDSLGNQIWLRETYNPGFSVIRSATSGEENYLFHGDPYFCGWCATGYYKQWNFNIFDEAGNAQLNDQINYYMTGNFDPMILQPFGYFFPICTGAMLMSDGSVLAVGESLMITINSNSLAMQHTFAPFAILGLHPLDDDESLIFASDSVVFKRDVNGILDTAFVFDFTIDSWQANDQNTFIVRSTDFKYYAIDQEGNILEELNPANTFNSIDHILWRDGKFWIFGETENGYQLRAFNRLEGYSFIRDISTEDFRPVGFELWAEHFLMIGYEPDLNNKHFIFKSIKYDEPEYEPEFSDIGIESILISAYVFTASNPLLRSIEFDVEVRNNGNNTINSVYLNSNPPSIDHPGIPGYVQCAANNYSNKFSDLNLQPGASAILKTSRFTIWAINSHISNGFCVWTSLPNDARDHDSSNDIACGFDYVMSINEIDRLQHVNIYPNPVHDELIIDIGETWNEEILLQILDIQGRIVITKVIPAYENPARIEVGSYPPGVYLLNLQSKQFNARRKFVK